MAKGYPDFFGMSIFPKYGLPRIEEGATTISDTNYNVLFTVSAKGITYGGMIYVATTTEVNTALIKLELDGTEVLAASLTGLENWGFNRPSGHYLYLGVYDTTTSKFIIYFSPGINFESEYKVSYKRGFAGDITVNHKFIYAEVV